MFNGFWWNLKGPARILHELSPLRLEFLGRCVSIQGKKILDFGCGGGIFSEELWKNGAEIVGSDVCEMTLAEAKKHAEYSGAKVVYETLENLSHFPKNYFDIILFMEVLEHVPCIFEVIQQWLSLLKPGGYIVGSTINRTSASYLKMIIAAEHILRWIPSGTHDWHAFIQPQEIKELLHRAGCRGWLEQGYRYLPLGYSPWNFCYSVKTNYFFATQKHCVAD